MDVLTLLAALADLPARLAVMERTAVEQSRKLDAVLRALPPSLVSVQQSAVTLGISVPTVRRWVKSGRVPSLRIGRSIRVDLSRFDVAGADETRALASSARVPSATRVRSIERTPGKKSSAE